MEQIGIRVLWILGGIIAFVFWLQLGSNITNQFASCETEKPANPIMCADMKPPR